MDARTITTFFPRLLIRIYQVLRPQSVRRCRFYPTCSEYMMEALQTKGLVTGLGLGTLRILKCHPWHPGGYDPLQQLTSSPAVSGGRSMDPRPTTAGDDE